MLTIIHSYLIAGVVTLSGRLMDSQKAFCVSGIVEVTANTSNAHLIVSALKNKNEAKNELPFPYFYK